MDHRYKIFESAHGHCGIAWTSAGIARFQLPDRNAEATERNLLKRLPGARAGAPSPAVAETIAAIQRYFAGEKVEFGRHRLDLDGQEEFFRQVYAAARRIGWGLHDDLRRPGEGVRRRLGNRPRNRPGRWRKIPWR